MLLDNQNIRWGIIGLGNIAHKFAQDLRTTAHAELYAVASRSQAKADAFSNTYGAKEAYNSYDTLVKNNMIDAVYIATPHVWHKDHTLLCLRHGKAVLCEKPFAMNAREVEAIMLMAKTKGLLVMEAMWTRFLPHYNYSTTLLEEGILGKPLTVEANFGFCSKYTPKSRLYEKELGGGSLLDIGIYPVMIALSTLGTPDTVAASAEYFDTGVDASCTVTFRYEKGATALLKSTLKEDTPTTATFCCEKGTLTINSGFHKPSTVTIKNDTGIKTIDFNYTTLGYNYEIIHFNQLLREGKTESPVMTFDFSKKLITTLDRIRDQIGLSY